MSRKKWMNPLKFWWNALCGLSLSRYNVCRPKALMCNIYLPIHETWKICMFVPMLKPTDVSLVTLVCSMIMKSTDTKVLGYNLQILFIVAKEKHIFWGNVCVCILVPLRLWGFELNWNRPVDRIWSYVGVTRKPIHAFAHFYAQFWQHAHFPLPVPLTKSKTCTLVSSLCKNRINWHLTKSLRNTNQALRIYPLHPIGAPEGVRCNAHIFQTLISLLLVTNKLNKWALPILFCLGGKLLEVEVWKFVP